MLDDVRETADECPLPEGDYAIVEVMGHRKYIGRISEVQQYGSTMCCVEVVYGRGLLPPVLIGGGSIFAHTPCSREIAWANRPIELWQLPGPLSDAVSAAPLPTGQSAYDDDPDPFFYGSEIDGDDDDDDDDGVSL